MATAPKSLDQKITGKAITSSFVDAIKQLIDRQNINTERGHFTPQTFRQTTSAAMLADPKPENHGGETNSLTLPDDNVKNIDISIATPGGLLVERLTNLPETVDGSSDGLDKNPNKATGTETDDQDEKDRTNDDNHDDDTDHPRQERHGVVQTGDDGEGIFSCRPLSGQHKDFIEDNLEQLQNRCQQFYACTEELYNAENYHNILGGEQTRLKNICGLLYANGGGQSSSLNKECSPKERKGIRLRIDEELRKSLQTADPAADGTWHQLRHCVEDNKTSNETAIDTVCRLRGNSTYLCNDVHVNKETRNFFNHQLEHLHCSCVALDSISSGREGKWHIGRAIRFGVAGGVLVLLLVLIFAVVFLCLRHRKTKRKLQEHRMRYLPSAREEPSDVYQEIRDPHQAPKLPNRQTQQGKLLPHGYELDVAPSLPNRYVKGLNLSRGPSQRSPSDGDDRPHSYLEPLPEPLPEPSRAGGPAKQRAPATSVGGNNPYSLAKPIKDTSPTALKAFGSDGTYFDSIQVGQNRAAEDDMGYSRLKLPSDRLSTAERVSCNPEYFELESQVPSGRLSTAERVSCKREYFELEPQVEVVNDADTPDGVIISSTKL